MGIELAGEVGRLADAAESLLRRLERLEREQRDEGLKREWGPAIAKTDMGLFLHSIPGLAELFTRTVPSDFVAQTDESEFMIACPCGQEPIVKPRRLTNCECGRWFLHDGNNVRVAFSPKAPSEDTPPEPTPD